MKKRLINCLFICLLFSSATFAQKAKLGTVSENAQGELLATDPVNGKQHYKAMSFSIKAGAGIVFYMQSTAFTPLVFMTGKNGSQAGSYNNPEKGKGQEATVALNAFRSDFPNFYPADSSINVYFTSVEENVTGKFTYGYIMLDSSQMVYDEKGPLCNRLIYLINQWQAGWFVIPDFKSLRQPHVKASYSTEYCLMPENPNNPDSKAYGHFRDYLLDKSHSYEETILESKTNNGTVIYDKLVADVKQCLGDKDWVFKTEVKEDKELNNKIFISSFQIKGGTKDQERTILSISRIVPEKVSEFNRYKVKLNFN
jgi:hypothetical protein